MVDKGCDVVGILDAQLRIGWWLYFGINYYFYMYNYILMCKHDKNWEIEELYISRTVYTCENNKIDKDGISTSGWPTGEILFSCLDCGYNKVFPNRHAKYIPKYIDEKCRESAFN